MQYRSFSLCAQAVEGTCSVERKAGKAESACARGLWAVSMPSSKVPRAHLMKLGCLLEPACVS